MSNSHEQVEILQGEIIDQSNLVFESMFDLAAQATDAALNADLSVSTSGLPVAPTWPHIDLSVADYNTALIFLGQLREDLMDDPVYPPDYIEGTYSSTLLTALFNLLYSDLINGGYGIDIRDEENLWNRARERELRSMQSQQDSATRQFARAGFPMPTGAAQKAMQQLQQESSEKIAQANRDIAIKRADMYVENRKHAMSTTIALEKLTIDNFNAQADRLLKHYEVNVTKVTEDYRIRTQAYAALAGAYVSLWGSNAGLAQAQAALATAEINGKVAIYRAEMDKVFEQAKLELEGKKTAAGIYAAIASAAMSAINVNTSMNASASASQSASSNYNYDQNA